MARVTVMARVMVMVMARVMVRVRRVNLMVQQVAAVMTKVIQIQRCPLVI